MIHNINIWPIDSFNRINRFYYANKNIKLKLTSKELMYIEKCDLIFILQLSLYW